MDSSRTVPAWPRCLLLVLLGGISCCGGLGFAAAIAAPPWGNPPAPSPGGTWPCLLEPHDKCLFIISTGRSGSTAVLDAVNQVEGVFVSGENAGLFQQIESMTSLIKSLNGDLSPGGEEPLRDPETLKRWYVYCQL